MARDQVIAMMRKIFQEATYGINHTLKVLEDAEVIADGEGVKSADRELIAIVAILHDIGAVEAKRKYGSTAAVYQEQEGPAIAAQILSDLNYEPRFIERVCFIIGHHHTPDKIDGIDFQIQWEADLLVNLEHMEVKDDQDRLPQFINDNFKTTTGKSIALARFMPH